MNYTYVSNRLKLQIVMSIKMILRRKIERIEINYLLPLIQYKINYSDQWKENIYESLLLTFVFATCTSTAVSRRIPNLPSS